MMDITGKRLAGLARGMRMFSDVVRLRPDLKNDTSSNCIDCGMNMPVDQMVKNEHGAGYLCKHCAPEWNGDLKNESGICSKCGHDSDPAKATFSVTLGGVCSEPGCRCTHEEPRKNSTDQKRDLALIAESEAAVSKLRAWLASHDEEELTQEHAKMVSQLSTEETVLAGLRKGLANSGTCLQCGKNPISSIPAVKKTEVCDQCYTSNTKKMKDNSDFSEWIVKYDGPNVKDLEVTLRIGTLQTEDDVKEYMREHYVQPTKILSIRKNSSTACEMCGAEGDTKYAGKLTKYKRDDGTSMLLCKICSSPEKLKREGFVNASSVLHLVTGGSGEPYSNWCDGKDGPNTDDSRKVTCPDCIAGRDTRNNSEQTCTECGVDLSKEDHRRDCALNDRENSNSLWCLTCGKEVTAEESNDCKANGHNVEVLQPPVKRNGLELGNAKYGNRENKDRVWNAYSFKAKTRNDSDIVFDAYSVQDAWVVLAYNLKCTAEEAKKRFTLSK